MARYNSEPDPGLLTEVETKRLSTLNSVLDIMGDDHPLMDWDDAVRLVEWVRSGTLPPAATSG